jgi:hypothetical protein
VGSLYRPKMELHENPLLQYQAAIAKVPNQLFND